MKLNGVQTKKFKEALMSAFSNQDELKVMLFEELNQQLNWVVTNDNYKVVVFELIEWAVSQGRLIELMRGASRSNPNNQILQNFVRGFITSNIKELLKDLLENNNELVSLNICHDIFKIIISINNLQLLVDKCCSVLPEDAYFESPKDTEDLENKELVDSLKVFIIIKLLVIDYPMFEGIPRVLWFARDLCKGNQLKKSVEQKIKQWITSTEQYCGCNLPDLPEISVSRKDDTLNCYLMITIKPWSDQRRFLINGFLRLPSLIEESNYSLDDIVPVDLVDLEEDGEQKGSLCTFKSIENKVVQFLREGERKLKTEVKKLNFSCYNLTIEFFLPYQYLCEEVDLWRVSELDDLVPIGKNYRVIVRSYDRVENEYLENELRKGWQRVKQLLNLNTQDVSSHFENLNTVSNCNWKNLEMQLRESKIGLKLTCAPPDSQKQKQELFKAFLRGGTPIAIWTRCHNIPNVVSEIDNLLTKDSLTNLDYLFELIWRKRCKAHCDLTPKEHLGYHLAILCDNPERMPPLEANPLRE
ncbi:MAG: hypothetical protein F6K58_00075 [Symploca sp. SIO2E9]|nr:hypothetical protein [Symploca sp. SIO2E9]